MAVFPLLGGTNFSSQSVHHELQAVADAEHGKAKLEDARVRRGSIFVVDRPWSSRKHYAHGSAVFYLRQRGRARKHYGKYILLANAPRDELGVLRAEIEDDDGFA